MPFVKDKAVTIHNGIDLGHFDPTRRCFAVLQASGPKRCTRS
jgi:hypothetical protein